MEAEKTLDIITARRLNLYHREAMGNIAPAETSPAQAAHQIGEHLTFNGVLYRVEVGIEPGGTLIPGTNIVRTTVEEMAGESGGGGSGGSTDLGESCTTVFNADGSITQTYSDMIKNTVFNSDGSITESLSTLDGTIYETKTTVFNADGSISEAVTNV